MNLFSNIFKKTTKYVKGKLTTLAQPIRWVVFCYGFLVVIILITFYGIWLYMWYIGKENLNTLLTFLKEVTGGAFIAFIAFIGGCFIDSDGDGIPDSFDKHDDKKDNERGGPK